MTSESFRIPLLHDHHTHPLLYAAFMDGIDLNQASTETREQAINRIRDQARTTQQGWTIAYGWNSGRYALSKEEFDDLPPLVILNLSLHGLIVNDAGQELLQRSDPVAAANLTDQDWYERNLRRVLNVFANEGASAERLARFFRRLLVEQGIYHAEELLLVDENEIRLFEEAELLGRTRFWVSPDQYEKLSPHARGQIHGIKLFTDGAFGAWTAALHHPYRGSTDTGMLLYERNELESLLARYLGMGKPMALHAIGDRAIDQVVSTVENVGHPDETEIRIEHAQLISESTARRAKALGIQLSMQPNFSDDSIHYTDRLPDEYLESNNPFRMLIDRVGYVPGIDLFFGSDGMPHGIGDGLRQSLFPPYAGQTLTIEEFVAGYGMRDRGVGHIEVQIDPRERRVTYQVVLERSEE